MSDSLQASLWPEEKPAASAKDSTLFENESERIDERLRALTHSNFRMSWHLKRQQVQYIQEKGLETIARHCDEMIASRLAPAFIPNDGSQTPMKGHPVFIAQHATGTCCRRCLKKWHHIEPSKAFTYAQQHYVTTLIMTWINRELSHWQLPLPAPTKAADRKRPPTVRRQKKADGTSMDLFG